MNSWFIRKEYAQGFVGSVSSGVRGGWGSSGEENDTGPVTTLFVCCAPFALKNKVECKKHLSKMISSSTHLLENTGAYQFVTPHCIVLLQK